MAALADQDGLGSDDDVELKLEGVTEEVEDGAGEGGATAVYGRRNPWGSASYADLISQAISGSPDGRLTLSQIYDWMVAHIPYFTDRQSNSKSAGWKVISERNC